MNTTISTSIRLFSLLPLFLLISCGQESNQAEIGVAKEPVMTNEETAYRSEGLKEAVAAAEATRAVANEVVDEVAANNGDEAIRKLYQQSCISCHAYGAAGAPKAHDPKAWQPRLAKGRDSIMQSMIQGIGGMPPRGLCASCSDDDLWALTEYMSKPLD